MQAGANSCHPDPFTSQIAIISPQAAPSQTAVVCRQTLPSQQSAPHFFVINNNKKTPAEVCNFKVPVKWRDNGYSSASVWLHDGAPSLRIIIFFTWQPYVLAGTRQQCKTDLDVVNDLNEHNNMFWASLQAQYIY